MVVVEAEVEMEAEVDELGHLRSLASHLVQSQHPKIVVTSQMQAYAGGTNILENPRHLHACFLQDSASE